MSAPPGPPPATVAPLNLGHPSYNPNNPWNNSSSTLGGGGSGPPPSYDPNTRPSTSGSGYSQAETVRADHNGDRDEMYTPPDGPPPPKKQHGADNATTTRDAFGSGAPQGYVPQSMVYGQQAQQGAFGGNVDKYGNPMPAAWGPPQGGFIQQQQGPPQVQHETVVVKKESSCCSTCCGVFSACVCFEMLC